MNPLAQSLGLDNVSADVNSIPDGVYDGTLVAVNIRNSEKKNKLLHVWDFAPEGGDYKGRRKGQVFQLGENAKFDNNGNLVSYDATMSDEQKSYYKKMYVDLGVPEQMVSATDPASLIGTPVTFTVKTNAAGYQNITNVVKRGATAADSNSEFTAPAPAATAGINLSDQL